MNLQCILVFLLYSTTFHSTVLADDDDGTSIIYLTDGHESERWSPKSSENVLVQVDPGYQIVVNVTVCDMDAVSGDNAVIKGQNVNDTGLLFTYLLGTKKSYLYNTEKVSVSLILTNSSSNFTAIFTRVGEPLTTITTTEPTTTIILPTPSNNDSDTITVYLYGKEVKKITTNDVKNLRNVIAEMAARYCSDENFPLNESVRAENVQIKEITQCRMAWNNFDRCVYATFAVPVNLIEDSPSPWNGYQLNSNHLTLMWNRFAKDYIADIGFSLYPVPNIQNIISWRIAVICLVTVVFVAFLTVTRHLVMKSFTVNRRRKLSDAISFTSNSDRYSQLSLRQHYMQETPSWLETSHPAYAYPSEKIGFPEAAFSEYEKHDDIEIDEDISEEEPKIIINDILFEREAEVESETET